MNSSALLFVGCGPGRPGGDTMKRLLCTHPSVRPLADRDVLVLEAVAELVSAVEDGPSYLPRAAALAFRTFTQTMARRLGERSMAFLDALEERVVTGRVHIHDYGELPLVEPWGRSRWLEELGRCFTDLPNDRYGYACDKHGPNMLAGDLAAGLGASNRLVSVTRHPVAAAVSLSASKVVGMPLEESCALVSMHYERWLARDQREHEIVVRFEDILRDPMDALRVVGDRLGLEDADRWSAGAATLVGPVSDPRTVCSELAKAAETMLFDLSRALGYSDGY